MQNGYRLIILNSVSQLIDQWKSLFLNRKQAKQQADKVKY